MVQEFNVLRCFSCETFQVDQVKKSTNKWTCKVCNEKQSIKQVFLKGSGKECRLKVQSLNFQKGMKSFPTNDYSVPGSLLQGSADFGNANELETDFSTVPKKIFTASERLEDDMETGNRWARFINKGGKSEDEEDNSKDYTTERSSFEERRKMQRMKCSKIKSRESKPYPSNRNNLQADNKDKAAVISGTELRKNEHTQNTVKENAGDYNENGWGKVQNEFLVETRSGKIGSKWGQFLTANVDTGNS